MTSPIESLSILIIDGAEPDRELLKRRIQDTPWPCRVEFAPDGERALRLLKESFYDLVFMAFRIPGEDGMALLEKIRQHHAKSAVVVTCGDGDAQTAVTAMKKGALDFLDREDLSRTAFDVLFRRVVDMRNLRNQNMELRQVNQMKNEFIANISHELRTPLTVILGYAQSLHDLTLGPLKEAQLKALDAVIARSEELLGTLNHILRMREFVEGRRLAELRPADLREIWSVGVKKAAPELSRRDMRLEYAPPDAPLWVMADAGALADVCDNLLSNAVKFSPPGGVIRLRLSVSDGRALASLQDRGEGITPELLPRIFEDFSTASTQGPTRARPGLGLGLALSKQVVEMHSGSIWLESPGPGQGCTANMSLPLTEPGRPAAVVERAAALDKKRVLVVEDNPDLIDIIVLFVSGISANLELATARSGFEALESIKNQVPHLIILDIMMPGMNGIELLERLRRLPATDRIPVMVMTGYHEATQLARDAGAQEVLSKPFDRKTFVSKVLQLLHQGELPSSRG